MCSIHVTEKHNGREKQARATRPVNDKQQQQQQKKLYGFSGSEENMVQKLAQTSLEKKHQSSTEYSRLAYFREPLQLLLFGAFLFVKLNKHE